VLSVLSAARRLVSESNFSNYKNSLPTANCAKPADFCGGKNCFPKPPESSMPAAEKQKTPDNRRFRENQEKLGAK
ncbi:MAG: hypothetical protein Q4G28_12885, partial [Neisseria sp.]|nr:hypothetical protein [Neisseria sp.]